MKSTRHIVELDTMQALRCVQYRLPQPDGLTKGSYLLALALRYGMLGIATAHHLLIYADGSPADARNLAEGWDEIVQDHLEWEIRGRIKVTLSDADVALVGRRAATVLRAYLPLYRRLYPLERSLELITALFLGEHRNTIDGRWFIFRRKGAGQIFRSLAADSVFFAKSFSERRSEDIDEVPEIALIGE